MNALSATGKPPSGERLARLADSPRFNKGTFHNELKRRDGSYLKMTYDFVAGGSKHRMPTDALPVQERSRADYATPPDSGLRVTWLGHSTLLIEIDGVNVLVDPVWGERTSPFTWMGPKRFHAPPLPLSQLPRIDAVVISHDHYDHLDYPTILALGDTIPQYIVPLGVGSHLEQWGVSPERIVERDWWGEVQVGDVTLVATPARHFSGRSIVMADQNRTLWSGWAMVGPEHRVYYSGDTAMFDGFTEIGERLGPFDLTLIETGAYNAMWADVHLGPEQALQAHAMVRGKLFMPVHWGTFDLALHAWTEPVERALARAAQLGENVVVPKPGERFEPHAPPAVVRWWPEVPWETAEQAPVVSSGLGKLALSAPERTAEPALAE